MTSLSSKQGSQPAKHTPGPWRVARDNYGITRIWGMDGEGDDAGECDIACAEGDGSIPPERREANSRLIAAAPDLLEALEVATLELHEANLAIRNRNQMRNPELTIAAEQKAKAAISKALGEPL